MRGGSVSGAAIQRQIHKRAHASGQFWEQLISFYVVVCDEQPEGTKTYYIRLKRRKNLEVY